uniref:Secreted protein n=1 Tax=Streptomyces sp. NBC_00049 TaxID=2903617 RepID=A0AAU2JM63_9ACTN
MEAALIIFALMVLFAFLGLGVYVTAKVVGAAKRGVDRTITQARRTVEDTTLRAKSFGQVGVAGSLAQLRLDLRMSMRSTQEALHDGVRADASLKESIALFERLSAHGHELDDELKRLEQEPDRKRTAESLPDLRERAAKITQAADSLRWAARERARRFADDELSTLSEQIEVESGALRDWSRESVDDLAATAAAWDAAQQARPQSPAQGSQGQAPGQTSGEAPAAGGRGADPQPAALNPAAPTAQYSWQKTRRPESTT